MGSASSLPSCSSIVARETLKFLPYAEMARLPLVLPRETQLWLWAVERLAGERLLTVVPAARFAEVDVASYRDYARGRRRPRAPGRGIGPLVIGPCRPTSPRKVLEGI